MVFLGVYYTSLDFDGVGAEGYTVTFHMPISYLEIRSEYNGNLKSKFSLSINPIFSGETDPHISFSFDV